MDKSIRILPESLESIGYKKDNDELFKTYIENTYWNGIFTREDNPDTWVRGRDTEFIVRAECNLNCEYCYYTMNRERLIPKEDRVCKEKVLDNIRVILNTFKIKKILIRDLELFAGEMVSDGILFDIFDLYYDYISYAKNNCDFYYDVEENESPVTISIPINAFSLRDKSIRDRIVEYWDKFKNDLDVSLIMSISTDGLYAVDDRENSNVMTQEFYDELHAFAKRICTGFHPMISSHNVKNAIKNLHWWAYMFDKYDFPMPYPMQMAVRNGDWTEETIEIYLEYIKELWKVRFEYFNEDIEKMAKFIFCVETNSRLHGYDQLNIKVMNHSKAQAYPCKNQKALQINVATEDITAELCHRLTYREFKGGKFITDGEKIVDAEAYEGLSTFLAVKSIDPVLNSVCNTCDYKYICEKGCLGAQFEYSGMVQFPIPCVCELESRRTELLLDLCDQTGVLQYAIDNDYFNHFKKLIKTFIDYRENSKGEIKHVN